MNGGCTGDGGGAFRRTTVLGTDRTAVLCIEAGEGVAVAALRLDLPFSGVGTDPGVTFLRAELADAGEDAILEQVVTEDGVRLALVSGREEGFRDGRVRVLLSYRVMEPSSAERPSFSLEDVRVTRALDTSIRNRTEGVRLSWGEDEPGGTEAETAPDEHRS